jgi:DNA-binding NarL/FixJ family response regulator
MIRVLLVDDQSLLRMGFRLILEAEPDIEVIGEAADGATGVSMASALYPDVVLMDVRMPGTDGIAATASITAVNPATKVLILTTFDLDEYVFAGLRAGASGFLLKDAPPAELLAAIRTVAGGEAVLAPTATRRLINQFVPLLPIPGGNPTAMPCSASSPTGNRPSSPSSPPGDPTVRSPPICTCPREPSRSMSGGYSPSSTSATVSKPSCWPTSPA